jgi:Ca-activated chloride channel homolog
VVSVLLSSMMLAAPGQDTSGGMAQEASGTPYTTGGRFLVQSDLVQVPVTVVTGNGHAVPGLTKEYFTIFDDRAPQVITHFTSEDAPASIGLVTDCSGSMEKRLSKAKEAVYALLKNANRDDEFFLIRFSGRPELEVGLTSETNRVRSAVKELRADGTTALFDAVQLAWTEMNKARYARKAVVLISDGEDNSSSITAAEFKQLAAENDTTIYTLFIGNLPDSPENSSKFTGAGLLGDIARQTGGQMFPVSNLKQLPGIAGKIGSWIRSQYVLGYVPANASRNYGYHRIRVKVSKPPGFPQLHPAWRLSYYLPER